MKDPKALSCIYLHGVLPLLEEVVQHDKQAQEIVKGWRCSVMLHVSDGPATTLKFRDGKCEAIPKTVSFPTIAMWFSSPERLNRMFEGGNVVPVIWKGIWHPVVLKKFAALTKRLDYYMKPTEEMAKDPLEFPFIAKLMEYAAVFGAKAVADNDPKTKRDIVPFMPSGVIQLVVQGGGPKAYMIKKGSEITVGKGDAPQTPDVFMEVRDAKVAFEMFTGKMDAMAGIGKCDIKIRGHIPLVDNLNALLDRLSQYIGS
ncbi:MAG: SCP2 sterol-binding domain-containing protein [bacterium]